MEELKTSHDHAEQSRINGAKSRGPVSEAGKKRVARNARRHGLSSASEVCLDSEDAVAFNRLHEGLLNTFSPVCDDGCQLVRQMALAILQQERCARREAEVWGDRELDPSLRLRELGLILRYRNAAVRVHHRARKELMLVLERPHLGVAMLGEHAERIPMEGDAPLAEEHAAIVEADEAQRTAYIEARVAEELRGPAKPANQSVAPTLPDALIGHEALIAKLMTG